MDPKEMMLKAARSLAKMAFTAGDAAHVAVELGAVIVALPCYPGCTPHGEACQACQARESLSKALLDSVMRITKHERESANWSLAECIESVKGTGQGMDALQQAVNAMGQERGPVS